VEIFGIGLPELLLIGVIALIVLGPERLPEAARTFGKGVADFRKAIEPARSAWNELTNEVTGVTSTISSAAGTTSTTGAKPRMAPVKSGGAKSTAMTTDNPWKVHPIMADMTPEEREVFMQGGQIPPRILDQLAKASSNGSGNGRLKGAFPEIVDIDYPMPHTTIAYQPAPAYEQALEDIDYPHPGATINPHEEESE